MSSNSSTASSPGKLPKPQLPANLRRKRLVAGLAENVEHLKENTEYLEALDALDKTGEWITFEDWRKLTPERRRKITTSIALSNSPERKKSATNEPLTSPVSTATSSLSSHGPRSTPISTNTKESSPFTGLGAETVPVCAMCVGSLLGRFLVVEALSMFGGHFLIRRKTGPGTYILCEATSRGSTNYSMNGLPSLPTYTFRPLKYSSSPSIPSSPTSRTNSPTGAGLTWYGHGRYGQWGHRCPWC